MQSTRFEHSSSYLPSTTRYQIGPENCSYWEYFQNIEVSGPHVADKTLYLVSKIQRIGKLSISGGEISPSAVECLPSYLYSLMVHDQSWSKDHFGALANSNSLSLLWLFDISFDEECLDAIESLTNLTYLCLVRCELNGDQVSKIRRALMRCEVVVKE